MAKASKKKSLETTEVDDSVKSPLTEEEVATVPEPVFEEKPVSEVAVEMPVGNKIIVNNEPKITYRKELDTSLSFEERIEAFLESRGSGQTIKLNDFLKSLFKLPAFNAPPEWLSQGACKSLRVILDKMQKEGKLTIVNNTHLKLGQGYYAGQQQVLQHRNLNDVVIMVKM